MGIKTEYNMIKTILQTEEVGNIKSYLNSLRIALNEKKEDLKNTRQYTHISFEDFKEMFILFAENSLIKKKQNRNFEIDSTNEIAIFQLWCFLTGNSNFKGSLFKGIMIVGSIGVGKTLIMNTFLDICEKTIYSQNLLTRLHSKDVAAKMKIQPPEPCILKSPLFIDDIGKESKTANDYGNVINPVTDLFSARYDNNALTFATANYSKDSFSKFYGDTISDRFVEMFNIIRVDGDKSRRM